MNFKENQEMYEKIDLAIKKGIKESNELFDKSIIEWKENTEKEVNKIKQENKTLNEILNSWVLKLNILNNGKDVEKKKIQAIYNEY